MSDKLCMGMTHLQLCDFFQAEYLVHHTGPVPKQHVPSGCPVNVATKIFVWCENDRLLLRKTFNYKFCIAAGTDHIAQGLYSSTTVNVTNHNMVTVLLFEF